MASLTSCDAMLDFHIFRSVGKFDNSIVKILSQISITSRSGLAGNHFHGCTTGVHHGTSINSDKKINVDFSQTSIIQHRR